MILKAFYSSDIFTITKGVPIHKVISLNLSGFTRCNEWDLVGM
jgi:hypothetical protein